MSAGSSVPVTTGLKAATALPRAARAAQIEPRGLVDSARGAAQGGDFFVCEGIGGLLVPFTTGYMVRDLALDLGLPLDEWIAAAA